jgi:chitin-binding protein
MNKEDFMRKRIALPLLAVAAVLTSLAVATPALAHGYVSSPASRQAMCAQGRVKNCGAIQYEPQSVEGPKGLRTCSAGNSRFAVLDDESKGWPATAVGKTVAFNWVFTARHATSNFEYYIGNTRLASFDGGGKQPGANVSHNVNLGNRTGRQKVLAIWNIADTTNAFYSCIDLQVS